MFVDFWAIALMFFAIFWRTILRRLRYVCRLRQAMLLVGQEIALTFDFCSTATRPLAKRGHPLWIPPLTKNLSVTKKIIHTTFFA